MINKKEKIMNTKLKNANDYLTVPFMATVNNKSFYSSTQIMKILVGVTGQGKTFSTAKIFIPHLIKNHGVKFVIVSAPQKGILEKEEFALGIAENGLTTQVTDNIDTALTYADNGISVVLIKCHAAIIHEDKGQKLQKFLLKKSIKFAIFVDEAHTWLCSDKENYKDVVGWSGAKHEAKYFKMLAKLSMVSPFIFGLTATPNAEQLGKISTIGDMSFEVINTFAPKPLLIDKTAYFGKTTFYTPNYNATEIAFEEFVKNVYDETESCGYKKTAIIACGIDTAANGFNKNVVKKILTNILIKNPYTSKDTKSIAIMTGEKIETGSYDLDGSFQKLTDDEIKKKLNDDNDPLMFLLVVNKGQMGMNVYTLKNYFTFKYTDKMDKSGDALEDFPIQGIGRLIRLNTGFSKISEFTKKYGYNLGNYMKTLNKEEKKNLLVANTMNIVVPDNAMWGAAIDTFQKVYSSSIVQAKTYFEVS